jgi:ABC-2 type transport system ATP-binding protein
MQSIVFDSVHKTFRRGGFFFSRQKQIETHALKGISLRVFPGEVLAVLGPNGSGKSTSLKLVSTMLLPDRGTVLVNGTDTQADSRLVRTQVGYALASERSFFPRLTVSENLEFFAALEDVCRRERSSRIRCVLKSVQLEDAADKQVMKLSSGMYQRLGIARALIKQPSILLLDEPTRSLDPAAASGLWASVRSLSSTGVTVLVATHNFAEALAVADRIAVLQAGNLMGLQPTAGRSVEQLRRFYFQLTGAEEPKLREEVPA